MLHYVEGNCVVSVMEYYRQYRTYEYKYVPNGKIYSIENIEDIT